MYFEKIIEALKSHPQVRGIMLGGSRASNSHDETSDYDVYVYVDKTIEEDERRELIGPYVKYMEYSNAFWELEDDGILLDGTDIEFIYRNIDDLDKTLTDIVLNHNAWSGYTTCFWDNLINSKVLYDPNNDLKALVDKYSIDFPVKLKENIILKNSKLLMDYMPSFYYQLDKAVQRNDLFSINHRLTELMASYFDIIFALNESTHPGEKRLIEKASKLEILPDDFTNLLDASFEEKGQDKLNAVKQVINNLYDLLENQGYKITRNSYKYEKSQK